MAKPVWKFPALRRTKPSANKSNTRTCHVAMYAGDGMMVEAGDPVQMNPVRTSNIGMPFMGFWRPTA